ncbi:nuclear transport factor 2 family protein [Ferrimonas balearica]|uniref:nuclear transport factor 2 family protein n=1 Tax=Ferrimonas balearica TaxID=44012 RepID=UPI001F3CE3EF|nr:nuclear transport factor 2 family protein [Ferrimonas balearica]MBY6095776.1 nuclear transport factor 2 family protein [Ferrimonas balearica]
MNAMLLSLVMLTMVPVTPTPMEQADDFFAVYAERKDFEALMAFYAEDAVLEDMVYGHIAEGREAIRRTLDWSRGEFRVLDGGPALTLTETVEDGSVVVVNGYFRPFEFGGDALGPWRFTIWLEFNDSGAIQRQTDWINYTPRQRYLGGENRNDAVDQ